jgi:serine/threonine-protein kinase
MSPEQIQGRPVEGKSDQFSLAVIAYELFTGEKPFRGESIAALAYAIVNEQPQPAHRLNPTLDWPVDTVLRRALAKDPQDRYPTCSDFVFALENACRTCRTWKPLPPGAASNQATVAGRAPIAAAAAAPIADRDTAPMTESRSAAVTEDGVPLPLRAARIVGAVVLGAVLIAAIAVGGLEYFGGDEASGPDPPPPAGGEQPASEQTRKPSAIPVLPGDEGAEESAQPARPEEARPQQATESPAAAPPAAPEPPKPKPAPTEAEGETRLVTNPPGAYVVVDGSSALSCQTPCSIPLGPGRHTLAATMSGYRRTLRIFESPRDSEIFLNLDRATGTVVVRSTPAGAAIVVDGQQWTERTPAMLSLPAGQHTIELVRDGQRESRQVNVRDAAISNLTVQFQ